MNNNEIAMILGEIRGDLRGIKTAQNKQHETLTVIDDRLRTVEAKATRNGLVAGGAAGVGFAILAESVKSIFTHGTPPGA